MHRNGVYKSALCFSDNWKYTCGYNDNNEMEIISEQNCAIVSRQVITAHSFTPDSNCCILQFVILFFLHLFKITTF